MSAQTRRTVEDSPLRPPLWSTFGIGVGIAALFVLFLVAAVAPLAPQAGLFEMGGLRFWIEPEDAELRSAGLAIFAAVSVTLFAASAHHTTALAKLERQLIERQRE